MFGFQTKNKETSTTSALAPKGVIYMETKRDTLEIFRNTLGTLRNTLGPLRSPFKNHKKTSGTLRNSKKHFNRNS